MKVTEPLQQRTRALLPRDVTRPFEVFVNGVPQRGGGIRPPLNGTRLVAPEGRALDPGEEYLIESGTAMVVQLPNRTELRIDAK